jgi:hypothetical protein
MVTNVSSGIIRKTSLGAMLACVGVAAIAPQTPTAATAPQTPPLAVTHSCMTVIETITGNGTRRHSKEGINP